MGTVEVREEAVSSVQCWFMTRSCDIFLTNGSLLSFSPELQALLMNQLTVKVSWCKRCKSSSRQIHFQEVTTYNMLSFLFISGPEEARPVHRVLLLQHPEAGDQPPAEVFSSFSFSSTCAT